MPLYLHEALSVPPAHQAAFFAAVERDYLPAARAAGMRPVGMWRLSSIKGDSREVVFLWEIDGWSVFKSISEALYGPGAAKSALRAWHDQSWEWIETRSGKLLRQRAEQRIIDMLGGRKISSLFCFQETMYIKPNKEWDYVHGLEAQLGPSMARKGLKMVGLFQPALSSGEITNLWAVERGFENMRVLGQPDPDEFYSGGYWMETALALREHWRSVWMVPVPVKL
jgi:hypothetical protein